MYDGKKKVIVDRREQSASESKAKSIDLSLSGIKNRKLRPPA